MNLCQWRKRQEREREAGRGNERRGEIPRSTKNGISLQAHKGERLSDM